jgi:TRAP transporter TAXI family solute receptor
VCALASIVVSGCAPAQERTDSPWHYGRLYIATGNTTGVFYQIGGGYADIISHHVPGYQATAEPTNAAVENIGRVTRGDCEIGLTFADVAADAISGREPFANDSQDLRAIARIYNNYAHVIVRSGIGIRGVADLRGRRVSTGSPGSGTSSVAVRLLRAVGIDPDRDIVRAPLSLPETVKGMRDGSLDALFWTAGLPTLGIADLMSTMGQTVDFLPVADLYPQLRAVYGGAYTLATIGTDVYGQASDVPTIAVGAMIVVSPEMPESLSYELTRVLYEYQADLAAAHPEGKNFSRASGHLTDPVPLHLGARRYYGCLDEPCQTTTH